MTTRHRNPLQTILHHQITHPTPGQVPLTRILDAYLATHPHPEEDDTNPEATTGIDTAAAGAGATVRGRVWSSRQDPTRMPVRVDLGGGARLWVDLHDLSRPTRAEADSLSSLARLYDVLAGIDQGAPEGGTLDAATLPGLSVPWQRLALVAAVDQYSALDYHPALLVMDQALAWQGVGSPRRASGMLRAVEGPVTDLSWAAYDGRLPTAAAAKVATAAGLLLDSPDTDPGVRAGFTTIRERAESAVPVVNDAEWEFITDLWAEELTAATRMGAVDTDTLMPALVLDPRLLPPRLLPWQGPDGTGVRLSRDDQGLRVDLDLRAGGLSRTGGATGLWALLVDAATGEQVAAATFAPAASGNTRRVDTPPARLTATLDVPPQQWEQLAVSVIACTPQDPAAAMLDASPVGALRVRAERFLLAAWATKRLAGATGDARLRARAQEYLSAARRVEDSIPAGADLTHGPGRALDVVLERADAPAGWPSEPTSAVVGEPLLAELLYGIDLDQLHTEATRDR